MKGSDNSFFLIRYTWRTPRDLDEINAYQMVNENLSYIPFNKILHGI